MGDHPLNGARRRIERAQTHLDTVKRQWDALPEQDKRVTVGSQFDADTNKITVPITGVPSVDPDWVFELSECMFNMRAALDYLAWELARWNLKQKGETREPKRTTQFPIATDEKRLQPGWIEDIHPNHVTILKWLQPYAPMHMGQFADAIAGGQVPPDIFTYTHVAYRLQDLHNADKHRLLSVTGIGSDTTLIGPFNAYDCEVTNANYFLGEAFTFEVGTKWAEFDVVRVTGADPRVEVPVNIKPAVYLNGFPVIKDFPVLRQYVEFCLDQFNKVLSP